jgi:hypothetical protein
LLFEPGNSRELAGEVKWARNHSQETAEMGRRAWRVMRKIIHSVRISIKEWKFINERWKTTSREMAGKRRYEAGWCREIRVFFIRV